MFLLEEKQSEWVHSQETFLNRYAYRYGGFIDSNVNVVKEKMIEAFKNVGYNGYFIEAKLPDITHYLKDYVGKKNGMHEKIRNIGKIDNTHMKHIEEITEWFNALNTWKAKQDRVELAAVEEVVYIEQPRVYLLSYCKVIVQSTPQISSSTFAATD